MIAKALKLSCPRAAKWIQVHFQKEKEVEQTKVSQFLPCDSESFPRNIWDYWVYTHYISSSIVLPREHLTFCHSDEDVQDQWKTHRKHGKAGFWDKLLHYYNLLRISSLQRKCYPSSKLLPHIHDMCSYCCRGKPGVAVCGTGKGGREERTSQTRGDYWFISVTMEAQGVCTDSLKYSIPWKPGAACASL